MRGAPHFREQHVLTMTFRQAVRNLAVVAMLLPAAPALAADFPTVIKNILDHQSDGPLTEMEPDKRAKMTDCVIQTLSALPSGLQRKIVDAGGLEEQEHAFGQVVDADHAKWRQTIAKECGHIATDG
jgi:hypothetical protein